MLTHDITFIVKTLDAAFALKNYLEYQYADWLSDHTPDNYWHTPNLCVITCSTEPISNGDTAFVNMFVDAIDVFRTIEAMQIAVANIASYKYHNIISYQIDELPYPYGGKTYFDIKKELNEMSKDLI